MNQSAEMDIDDLSPETGLEIEVEEDGLPDQGGQGRQASESELRDATDNVQKRIDKLVYQREEANRNLEAAREESRRLQEEAMRARSENEQMRALLSRSSSANLASQKDSAQARLDKARDNYRSAQADGDPEKLLEAQEAIADAKLALVRVEDQERMLASRQAAAPQTQRQQQPGSAPPPASQPNQRPKLSDRTTQWMKNNPWFSDPDHSDMAAMALGYHNKIIAAGVELESDEYFTSIDEEMRKRYPDYDWSALDDDVDSQSRNSGSPQAATATTGRPPVSGASRRDSGKGKMTRKVQLTRAEVELADRLGVTRESYAAEKLKKMQGEA